MGAKETDHNAGAPDHHLIPGLPEEIVVVHVLPRLPWFARPACRAISKSWKARLDRKNPQLEAKTRQLQAPLFIGLFLVCTYDKQIVIRDNGVVRGGMSCNGYQFQQHWRKLPPLKGDIVSPVTMIAMVASSGMVYVWSEREDCNSVFKMDMACGDWTWRSFRVPQNLGSEVVVFNGHIYAPIREQNKVVMYDMMSDKCWQLNAWYQEDLRVLSYQTVPGQHIEEMYALVEDETISDAKLELLKYDIRSESWRRWEEVPIPECRWSHLSEVQIVNGQCFEPVAESGTNVVWVDKEGEVISWFNSSLGMDWVVFNYNSAVDGKGLEYIQIMNGSLYGIFFEDREEEEEEEEEEEGQGGKDGGGSWLVKRFIMKGRLRVADESVAWEEVHEIGSFEERYKVGPSIMHPIDCYTLVA